MRRSLSSYLFSFLLFSLTSPLQVQAGLVPRLVSLLASQPKHRAATLKLLYLVSYEDRHKALFAHTDAVPVVMQMIINFPGDLLGKELAALAVGEVIQCCLTYFSVRVLNSYPPLIFFELL